MAAVRSLGGEAQRVEIIDRALDLGDWTADERAVVSWYTGAARRYHLRTLADYAVTVCKDRGLLAQGAARGRWRLSTAAEIAPHPFGRVFTAGVGLGDDPVEDDWSADEYEHVWFTRRSLQLSRGDHLFVLGAGRHSAVLGLYEVTSAGTSRTPPNPFQPERWPFAIGVRALAAVPPLEASPVPDVIAPRGMAHHIDDPVRQAALYQAIRGHEAAAPATSGTPGYDGTAAAVRTARPFDSDHTPSPANTGAGTPIDPEETLALQEKARQAHHQLLVTLAAELVRDGWNEIEEIPAAIDLRATRPDGQRVIFEAKTLNPGNETSQSRGALAQLLEYRLDYGQPDDLLCLVVDSALPVRRSDLLERLGVAALHASPEGLHPLNDAGDDVLGTTAAS